KPGDEFEIKLGYKHIHLIQVEDEKVDETNGNGSQIEE
ncbi:MAG: AbrB family transcriptional regulator, partial [Okeania sp. SIO2D1]|nr:AbrB family transcriptional regulator [Okeania sp. SIO2D1]